MLKRIAAFLLAIAFVFSAAYIYTEEIEITPEPTEIVEIIEIDSTEEPIIEITAEPVIEETVTEEPAVETETPAPIEEEVFKDIIEIPEEDWGEITKVFDRKVVISLAQEPHHYGDIAVLFATLIDFQPEDNPQFEWQYSTDQEEWITIIGETEQAYKFIVDEITAEYYYRVIVRI